ncbi:uncharacterized protein L969DRAFT_88217 [Mixia osmundae IAM 14324]|uniref:t-SNARE coiled-coil homology domain-containing protein n=1 Tax=Mixia osmundae (strain CBS 9802 / IAM 14324 / JCM 22182 / KY 12970) TaxID=764103 RepID=G7E0Y8_MIXOS|nr:uncharacterized protein L969DRAFT_88217 [Mixia osmundae IAM 14324]KEI38867.1 hypothetical protein L969DRAFT_88217 [Mixia osmundae IAM 14324]GAA96498.1 hypothetical protein E5Q_03166 [Mixia osmundae IAM 14324]
MAQSSLSGIFIRSHQTRTSPKTHIAYAVEVHESTSRTWTVWRRYSEFEDLDKDLLADVGSSPSHPSLPPKRSWTMKMGRGIHDESLIEERRLGLEQYLRGILGGRDDRFRQSHCFIAFIAAAPGASSSSKAALASTGFTVSTWLDEHASLVGLSREIRAELSRRDSLSTSGDSTASHQANVQAKKKLAQLVSRSTTLSKGLAELAKSGLPEGELRRRTDMISSLQDDAETLGKLSVASRHPARGAMPRESVSTGRAELLGSSAGLKRPGRTLGAGAKPVETTETRALDDHGLMQLQTQMMSAQDDRLSSLSAVVRRQKELSLAISHELESQNELLDGLSNDVDSSAAKLGSATKQLRRLG